jgi:hypothetical protein
MSKFLSRFTNSSRKHEAQKILVKKKKREGSGLCRVVFHHAQIGATKAKTARHS